MVLERISTSFSYWKIVPRMGQSGHKIYGRPLKIHTTGGLAGPFGGAEGWVRDTVLLGARNSWAVKMARAVLAGNARQGRVVGPSIVEEEASHEKRSAGRRRIHCLADGCCQ